MPLKADDPSVFNLEVNSMDPWEDGIVTLTAEGTISYANKSWEEFVRSCGPDTGRCSRAIDYLQVCDEETDEVATIAKGIKDVISGNAKIFKLEYSCDDTGEKRWYLIKVQPLSQDYPTSVLLQHIDITEKKKAELDLHESEQRFHTVFNNVHFAGVMLDRDGSILFCNDFLLDLTGWKREEILNRNWFDLFLPPEIVPEIKAVFYRTIEAANMPSYYENEMVTKDGNRRMVAWNNTVFKDGNGKISRIVSLGEDITDRKSTEKSLSMSKGQLRTLVDTIPDLVWLKDMNGVYLACNTKFERLYGAKEAKIVGKTDYDFVDKDLADFFTQKDREAMQADKPTMNEEEVTYADDGHREYLETIKSPMYDSNGQLIGILGVGRDITQRKQAEEELRKREMQLKRKLEIERILSIITYIFISSTDIDTTIMNALEKSGELCGASRSYIFLFPENGTVMGNTYEWCSEGVEPQKENLQDLPVKMFPWWMDKLHNGESIHIKDVSALPEEASKEKEILEMRGIRSLIALPLYTNNELIGFIGLDNVLNTGDWEEEDIAVLRMMSYTIGTGIEREQMETSLRESEKRLAYAQHVAHIGNWDWDIINNELYWSDEIYRIFGHTPQEFKGTYEAFLSFVHPDDRDFVQDSVNKALYENKPYSIDHRITLSDGSECVVHERGEVTFNEAGQAIRMIGTVQDITERKRVEEKLRKREMQLKTAQKVGGFGSWMVDFNSGEIRGSEEADKIYGLENENHTLEEIDEVILPEYRQITKTALRNLVVKKQPLDVEFWIKRPNDGEIRYLHSVAEYFAERNMIIGTIQDITDQKRAEDKIAEEAIRRRIFIEQSRDGIVVLDQNGKVFEANQRFADMLGYSLEEVLRLHVWDWDTQWTREELLEMLKNDDETGNFFETQQRRKDGTIIDVEISTNAAISSGQKLIFCVCRDITKRKEAEDELLQAKLAAEAANRAKSEFLASMSHELRTPLNSIIGFSQMLNDKIPGELNEKQARYVSNVLKSSGHLIELINDLLDLSKVEAGKMKLEYESFRVTDLIDEIVTSTQSLAKNKQIDIRTEISTDGLEIYADRRKIKDIMYNLLSNAVKFTPEKGEVRIETIRNDGKLQVSVSDNGIGISRGEQLKIFEPFKQVDSFMTRKFEGTGLGLALVKRYVEMHGGNIQVESDIGEGSTFTFILPIKPENEMQYGRVN